MQDRYVGDVGDFAKYALLRRLSGWDEEPRIRISVVWCRFPNETHTNDGRHVSYLRSARFRGLDDVLRLALEQLVRTGSRQISAVESAGILPFDTVYYDAPLTLGTHNSNQRLLHRNLWWDACWRAAKGSDLVFFDPDNGIETASIPKSHPRSGKYVYWDELMPFWDGGCALLIYHHLNRRSPSADQVLRLRRIFTDKLSNARAVSLVFRRGSARVFWLVHRKDAVGNELERRAADLLSRNWSKHFRPVGWPGLL